MPNLANRNIVFNNAYLHHDLYEKNEDVIDAIGRKYDPNG
jgi:hypothetical protein